ncbi:hypothetical protein KW845_17735 [Bordetella sp. BOR01]|nr:hypothetical protein [Bordetella sp. BOR01]MBV7484814.1 hypothetical protein [Bordetella sp. BOR01]
MSEQIVTSFIGILVIGPVFAYRMIEVALAVGAHGGGSILVQGQRSRGVRDEQVHQAGLDAPKFGHLAQDFIDGQMEAASTGRREVATYPLAGFLHEGRLPVPA